MYVGTGRQQKVPLTSTQVNCSTNVSLTRGKLYIGLLRTSTWWWTRFLSLFFPLCFSTRWWNLLENQLTNLLANFDGNLLRYKLKVVNLSFRWCMLDQNFRWSRQLKCQRFVSSFFCLQISFIDMYTYFCKKYYCSVNNNMKYS